MFQYTASVAIRASILEICLEAIACAAWWFVAIAFACLSNSVA